jgi:hypothetical protein
MSSYQDILEESKSSTGVVSFDKYTIGNISHLIKNSESSYYTSGAVYADVPTQFYFDEFFDRFNTKIKWISIGPKCYLSGIGDVICKTQYFNNLDDFDEFLSKNYGYLLIYSVNKQLDTLNLSSGYQWRIRFALVSNKQDIRDEKLKDILN